MTENTARSRITGVMLDERRDGCGRRPYQAPRILSRERLEAVAGICTKSTPPSCDPLIGGVISS